MLIGVLEIPSLGKKTKVTKQNQVYLQPFKDWSNLPVVDFFVCLF